MQAKLVQLDARNIPWRNQFDVVGIFDVLEHIEDDEAVLYQILQSMVRGGGVDYHSSTPVVVECCGRGRLPCEALFG